VLAAAQATSIHAPAKWRVNGPLANLPAFGQAFSCKAGAMQRPAAQQVALWR
jgi:putative endopeptidase